jgi:hypothetical protein
MLSRRKAGDQDRVIEEPELLFRNKLIIDPDADCFRVRFDGYGAGIDENAAFEVEAVSERIKHYRESGNEEQAEKCPEYERADFSHR